MPEFDIEKFKESIKEDTNSLFHNICYMLDIPPNDYRSFESNSNSFVFYIGVIGILSRALDNIDDNMSVVDLKNIINKIKGGK